MTTHPWWKGTTVYQIYPRSFADSNGDGIGDLPGIIERLDYLHDLGVETLWLSPFYQSPQVDFGYDISDHFGIAPEYGTLDDAHRLIDEVHARGMKIVFDMVLNHTSDRHPWFLESKSSRHSDKRDYYIWRDGRLPGGAAPPNNWRSMLGKSGWQYDAHSDQWYWASFLPCQPDLNYRNPVVKQAMLDVVRHWLGKGVDGLRLDIFNAIYKDASFADNPFSLRLIPSEDNPHGFFQRNVHTLDHPDTLAFARELRAVVDEHEGPSRFLVGEVFGSPESLKRYCGEDNDGLHMVFLFKAMRTRFESRAVRELLEEIERHFPDPFTPTYVFGNHDRPRFIHRLGEHHGKAKLLATLQLTARGVPFIYYGEEIGMGQHEIPLHQGLDPVAHQYRWVPQWLARYLRRFGMQLNRDEIRLPMQWHEGPHAGFAPEHARPWLPVHPRASEINVAAQAKDPQSLWHHYRALLRLRKTSRALCTGRLELIAQTDLPPDVLGYRRVHGPETVEVFLNFSSRERRLGLERAGARRVFSSRSALREELESGYVLGPYEALVLLPAPKRVEQTVEAEAEAYAV